jgi:two-component system cell cycle response regulator DivK
MHLLNKRIFLVEDNVANVVIEQMLLERQGAKTAMERWGLDTIKRLRKFMPVDLIILDLMFPDNITGYDIFNDIRAHSEFDGIPIVAVSASDPSVSIPRTKEHGFNGFISKPVNFDLFPQQIGEILDGERVWFKG